MSESTAMPVPPAASTPSERRRFLRGLLRLAALGGLAALTASAVARGRRVSCADRSRCGACPLAERCGARDQNGANAAGKNAETAKSEAWQTTSSR